MVDVPSTVKVQVNGIAGVSRWANVFHLKYSGGTPTVANLQTLAVDVGAAFIARFGTHLSANLALKSYIATDLASNTGARAEGALSGSGATSGTMLPGNAAVVVSWSISLRYRGGHPRTYLAGIPSGQLVDSETLGSSAVTAYANDANSFIADLNALTVGGLTWEFVAVQYWLHGAHPPTPLATGTTRPISAGVVHPRLDTQRRRLGKESF